MIMKCNNLRTGYMSLCNVIAAEAKMQNVKRPIDIDCRLKIEVQWKYENTIYMLANYNMIFIDARLSIDSLSRVVCAIRAT